STIKNGSSIVIIRARRVIKKQTEKKKARQDRTDQKQDQTKDDRENENVIAGRAFAGAALADQIDVLAVRFPEKIKGVAEKRDRADEVIEPDVKSHPKQRDLRNAVARTGD